MDFRRLNSMTPRDRVQVELLQSVLNQLKGSQVFSTLDLESGYLQISLSPTSRKLTAFTINNQRYEWVHMPFGLTNAVSTYARLMSTVLSGIKGVTNFLDDILIFAKDEEEHAQILEQVLSRLHQH